MRALAIAAMAVAGLFFLTAMVIRVVYYGHFGPSMMDDAFFFVRYGNNFLDTGEFSWNRGEGPIFGNTSQIYQFLVAALLWLTQHNAVLSLTIAANLGAIAYLVILPATYWVSRPAIDPTLRLMVTVALVVLIAFDGQVFLLLGTGMETTWAMALVSLSLLASFRIQNGETGNRALLLNALCIAAVYATRPDATLIVLAAPAGLVLFSGQATLRRAGFKLGLLSLALIAAIVCLCWIYYGDPLPLSAVAKTIPITKLLEEDYGLAFAVPWRHLYDTAIWHEPEIILGFVALCFFWRLSPVLLGATIGTLVFIAYHVAFVLPIMGYFGRYFGPILPVLMLLAASTIEAIVNRSRATSGLKQIGISGAALLLGLVLLSLPKILPTAIRVVAFHYPDHHRDLTLSRSDVAMAHVAHEFPFFGAKMVDMVAVLDKDCAVASTEDGILSAYARQARIVDYSGLHDRQTAYEGFSAERMLRQSRPDVLALPPIWYWDWDRAIQEHPLFARDYVTGPALGTTDYPMAFRKGSACAARVRHAVYGK